MKTTSPQTLALMEEILAAAKLCKIDVVRTQTQMLLNRLYSLANFAEARNILLYLPYHGGFEYDDIINNLFLLNKNLFFACYDENQPLKILQANSPKDLNFKTAFNFGNAAPNTCKQVRLNAIDIMLVNGIAFDEKANRMGSGGELYEKLEARLLPTVRKIALAFESQFLPAVPADARNKPVDIIVTDKRTLYKI